MRFFFLYDSNVLSPVQSPVGDKLNNIAQGFFIPVGEQAVIGIQSIHSVEIRISDADDDDAHRKIGSVDDGVHGVGHVGDDAVGYDEKHVVIVAAHVGGCDCRHVVYDRGEVGRSVQLDRTNGILESRKRSSDYCSHYINKELSSKRQRFNWAVYSPPGKLP